METGREKTPVRSMLFSDTGAGACGVGIGADANRLTGDRFGVDKDIEVAGVARCTMECHRVAAYDQIFHFMLVEQLEQISEV
jgi:hypothetical protein